MNGKNAVCGLRSQAAVNGQQLRQKSANNINCIYKSGHESGIDFCGSSAVILMRMYGECIRQDRASLFRLSFDENRDVRIHGL